MSAMAGGGGVIRWPEKKQVYIGNLAKLEDIPARGDRLHDGDNEDMLIGFLGVLEKTLAPGGGPLGADPAQAVRGIHGESGGLFQLLRGLDPGDDDAVGADIQGTFDQASI